MHISTLLAFRLLTCQYLRLDWDPVSLVERIVKGSRNESYSLCYVDKYSSVRRCLVKLARDITPC